MLFLADVSPPPWPAPGSLGLVLASGGISFLAETASCISSGVELLALLMVPLAIAVATIRSVRAMIAFYRLLALLLAIVIGWLAQTQLEGAARDVLTLFALIVPFLFLACSIRLLLAIATLPDRVSLVGAARNLIRPAAGQNDRAPGTAAAGGSALARAWKVRRDGHRNMMRDPLLIWSQYDLPQSRQLAALIVSVLLVSGMAYLAVTIHEAQPQCSGAVASVRISVSVSLSLIVLGIFSMMNRRDLISQIIGVLVMDQGLFLAAVLLATTGMQMTNYPVLIVGCMSLYIVITIIILVVLLPDLRRASGSIEIADQAELYG